MHQSHTSTKTETNTGQDLVTKRHAACSAAGRDRDCNLVQLYCFVKSTIQLLVYYSGVFP
eukprot:COSAG01_NODE_5754_length_4054_cov_28.824526_10_plen_60_part_00